MSIIWSPDCSNWNTITPDIAACLKGQISGPPVVRVSLERQELKDITVQQLRDFQGQGVPTLGYTWPYASDVPEQVAQEAVTLVDPYIGIKRLCADVEDTTNFLRRKGMPVGSVPKRWLSVDASKQQLRAAGPAVAVNWLRRWVTEIRTLGYAVTFYSAPGVWDIITGGVTSFGDVDGWGADWDGIPDPSVIDSWGGITNWIGKQYLGSGNAPTICGQAFDLNVWVKEAIFPTPLPVPDPIPDPVPAGSEPDAARLNQVLQARFALARQGFALLEQAFAVDAPGGSQ